MFSDLKQPEELLNESENLVRKKDKGEVVAILFKMIRKLRYFSLVTFVSRSKEEEKAILENICGQSVSMNVKAWAWPRTCSAACLNTDSAYVLGEKEH